MRRYLALLLVAGGCGDDGAAVDAAVLPSDAGAIGDASAPGGDATAPLSWVDFSITGCSDGPEPADDAGAAQPCRGPAPLTLRFNAIAPAPIDAYQWRFGDADAGVTATGAAPERTFALPGRYDVSLDVAGPGGTAGTHVPGVVEAVAAPLGYRCSVDLQCESGECVCGDGDGCAAPFDTGLCSRGCETDADCGDGVCAQLDPTGTGAAPWQRALCLPDCAGGAACPAGTTCQSLRGAGGSWVQACLRPGALGRIGDPCAGPAGDFDGSLCASGECLPVGSRGLCSASCADAPCPDGSACASFDGGSPAPACIAACTEVACDHDPAVACQLPGDGFELPTGASGEHCAPLP